MKEETTFSLTVARVYETLFSGDAVSVTVPAVEGELTILANHEPLITKLKDGTITVRTGSLKQTFAISSGLLETSNGQVTLLV